MVNLDCTACKVTSDDPMMYKHLAVGQDHSWIDEYENDQF